MAAITDAPITAQAMASPADGPRRRPPRASTAAAAEATATMTPITTDVLATLVASQPATLSGANGGPRLVAYHGRKAATTMAIPEIMPT
jgi:hypothetical protein